MAVNPWPVIETERLILRGPQAGDHVALGAMLADPQVHRYLGPRAARPLADVFSRNLRGAGSWALYGYGFFLAHHRESGELVGQGGVFHTLRGFGEGLDDVPEAGWMTAAKFWGGGYAGEMMRAALGWFDAAHGPRRIACMIEEGNEASFRLAGKLGFVAYGEHVLDDGAKVTLLERGG